MAIDDRWNNKFRHRVISTHGHAAHSSGIDGTIYFGCFRTASSYREVDFKLAEVTHSYRSVCAPASEDGVSNTAVRRGRLASSMNHVSFK
jgi:hypothetical protein